MHSLFLLCIYNASILDLCIWIWCVWSAVYNASILAAVQEGGNTGKKHSTQLNKLHLEQGSMVLTPLKCMQRFFYYASLFRPLFTWSGLWLWSAYPAGDLYSCWSLLSRRMTGPWALLHPRLLVSHTQAVSLAQAPNDRDLELQLQWV